MTRHIDFALRAEFIPLDALLKATGLAESGGRAKAMVAEGLVRVDGHTEWRKTCKLRAGQCAQLSDVSIHVHAPSSGPSASDGLQVGPPDFPADAELTQRS